MTRPRDGAPPMTDTSTINAESELVARLREIDARLLRLSKEYALHEPDDDVVILIEDDAKFLIATIERLASAHDEATAYLTRATDSEAKLFECRERARHLRSEGVDAAANSCREIAEELASAGGPPEAVAAVYRVYRRIRTLSPAASAHEQGRREGIEMAADALLDFRDKYVDEMRGQTTPADTAVAHWLFKASKAIRALSPAPPPEK